MDRIKRRRSDKYLLHKFTIAKDTLIPIPEYTSRLTVYYTSFSNSRSGIYSPSL